jgi:alkylation response protein AidB-like acyl-CoA dehydrogenase
MSTTKSMRSVLTDDLLARCGERAAGYDRDNRFFHEDLEDLRAANYLVAAVPESFGGLGLTLAEICQEQRRLARLSAPTALALNMHILNTGIAAELHRHDDHSQDWVLEEAGKGAIFAFGASESGCDLPHLYSTTKAERTDGGYRFSGHKNFGTLSPVWKYLCITGMDVGDPTGQKLIHAIVPRETQGYRIVETWDTMGMRATSSQDTLLEGVFVPDTQILRVLPTGFAGADLYILSLFAWAEPTFGNIYLGLAERARDLTLERLKRRSNIAEMTRSMAYHPGVQHLVAEMMLELEGAIPHLDRIAQDWTDGVDHGGMWPAKLVAAKHHGVEAAFRCVDRAMDLSGGRGMFRSDEMERIFRDCRAGRFHPANTMLVHEVVGKSALGILGESGPRWG